jgi:hypothetical protein
VWSYTPRQIVGFLDLAHKRRKAQAAEQLSLNTLAARGEPQEVERQHRELTNPWR